MAQFSGLKTDYIVLKMIFYESRHIDIDHKKNMDETYYFIMEKHFSETFLIKNESFKTFFLKINFRQEKIILLVSFFLERFEPIDSISGIHVPR